VSGSTTLLGEANLVNKQADLATNNNTLGALGCTVYIAKVTTTVTYNNSLQSKKASTNEENSTATRNVNKTEEGQLLIIGLVVRVVLEVSMPDRNGDRVIGDLSRRNELRNAFVDRFR
jgi:hypothetical protein